MAITEKVSAEELFGYTNRILEGLHAKGIWPVSYACDGTSKERSTQKLLRHAAHTIDSRTIRAPSSLVQDIEINIPLFHGKPLALIQDSKHALKTFRNNMMTGTKTMVLGDFPVLYRHLREMAFDEDSPLYRRDVVKPDKQDDRAAARVTSATSLEFLLTKDDEYFGTAIYTFVVGELIDGIQSRPLSFFSRPRMVLRAAYFIQIWRKFLGKAGYPTAKHCLSRDSLDIVSFVVGGFFELFFIYRDYFKEEKVPYVPWLHSTETSEHLFAECRKQVKDFDFAAFLHMMPKIHWQVRSAVNDDKTSTEDAKGRAQGYMHTWKDTEGMSVKNLVTFPTDEELLDIARLAFEDAQDLWMQLGVFPQDLVETSVSDRADERDEIDVECRALPSISYFDSYLLDDTSTSGKGSGEVSEKEKKTGPSIYETERAVLERMFTEEQRAEASGPIRLNSIDDDMLSLSCAKLFLDFDTNLRM